MTNFHSVDDFTDQAAGRPISHGIYKDAGSFSFCAAIPGPFVPLPYVTDLADTATFLSGARQETMANVLSFGRYL